MSLLRTLRTGTASLAVLLVLSACSSEPGLSPFSSDGCSLFPDKSLITSADWCSCCFEHDLAYWRGGTAGQREAADLALQSCIVDKTGKSALGKLMFEGVRVGGSPYFYNWYRWGYGWSFERKYQALTVDENQDADQLLEAYFKGEPEAVCKSP